jgi:hypothetical protein
MTKRESLIQQAEQYIANHDPLCTDRAGVMVDFATSLQAAPPTDDIKAVFAHWQNQHAKPASKLDAKRTSRIRTALKTFDVEQLCLAIDGALKDSWLMGKDEKSAGKKYNGIETILRDAGQIERLIDLAGPRRTARVVKPAWDFPLVQVGEVIKDGR